MSTKTPPYQLWYKATFHLDWDWKRSNYSPQHPGIELPGLNGVSFEILSPAEGTHAILRLISLHLRGEMPSFLISTSIPYLAKDESKDDRYRTSRTVYDLTSQPYNDFYIAGAGCHRSVDHQWLPMSTLKEIQSNCSRGGFDVQVELMHPAALSSASDPMWGEANEVHLKPTK